MCTTQIMVSSSLFLVNKRAVFDRGITCLYEPIDIGLIGACIVSVGN